MKLSPLEVRKQSFRSTMRGFDKEDVRIFLDLVADEYEKVLQENGMLSEKIRYLNERLEEYHTLEKTLQNSILMAERVAAESREQARLDAENTINDANVRAERILGDSRNRLRILGEQIGHLSSQKDSFVNQFQALLDAQSQFLLTHQEDLEVIEELEVQTTDLISETTPEYENIENESPIAEESSQSDFESAPSAMTTAENERTAMTDQLASAATSESEISRENTEDEFPHQSETPAYDGHRISPDRRPPQAARIRENAPSSNGQEEDDSGFFGPEERPEGFFELNAEEGARQ